MTEVGTRRHPPLRQPGHGHIPIHRRRTSHDVHEPASLHHLARREGSVPHPSPPAATSTSGPFTPARIFRYPRSVPIHQVVADIVALVGFYQDGGIPAQPNHARPASMIPESRRVANHGFRTIGTDSLMNLRRSGHQLWPAVSFDGETVAQTVRRALGARRQVSRASWQGSGEGAPGWRGARARARRASRSRPRLRRGSQPDMWPGPGRDGRRRARQP